MAELRIKINDDIKKNAEILFEKMGVGLNEAIKMFISQSINDKAFPFKPHIGENIPNSKTLSSFKEIKDGKSTTSSFQNFKKELDDL